MDALSPFVAMTFWVGRSQRRHHNDKFGPTGKRALRISSGAVLRGERAGDPRTTSSSIPRMWTMSCSVPMVFRDRDEVDEHRVASRHRAGAYLREKSVRPAAYQPRAHVRCLLRSVGMELPVTPVVIQWGPGVGPPQLVDTVVRRGARSPGSSSGQQCAEEVEGVSFAGWLPTFWTGCVPRRSRVEGRPSPAPQPMTATPR